MIKVKNVFNVTLLLLFFLDSSAQLQSLWKIGNLDNSGNEFALAPHQYKNLVAGFGGENTVYYVGHSTPNDWPYAMPGPLDSWGGGGYWSGFHPRHFRSARLNGKTITDFRILQSDVLKGGKLELEMGAQPVDTNAR